MKDDKDLLAPPTQDEMDLFAPPTKEETDLFAAPTADELDQGIEIPLAGTALNTSMGAAGGALAGKGTKELLKAASNVNIDANKVLSAFGSLTSEDIQHIRSNPDKYSKAPDFADAAKNLENASQDINKAGYRAAKLADESLPKEPIPTKTYYETLGEAANKPEHYSQMSKEAVNNIAQAHLSKRLPELNSLDESIKQIDNEINKQSQTVIKRKPSTDLPSKAMSLSDVQVVPDVTATGMQQDPFERVKKLTELKNQYTEAKNKILLDVNKSVNSDIASNLNKLPSEITKNVPSLTDVVYDPVKAQQLEEAVSLARGAENITPQRMAEGILQQLRDKSSYVTGGPEKAKFNTELAESIRGLLGSKYAEYDTLKQMSKKAIDLKEDMQKLGLSFDDAGNVQFLGGSKAKLMKIVRNPKMYEQEMKSLQRVIDAYPQLTQNAYSIAGLTPTSNAITDIPEQLKSGAIKNVVAGATEEANLYHQSPIKSYIARNVTPIQEKAAIGLGKLDEVVDPITGKISKIAKSIAGEGSLLKSTGAKVLENLPVAGAVLGGLAGASSAMAAGLSPEASLAVGTAEAFNPIPLTDVASGVVEAKKEYEKSQSIPKTIAAGAKGLVSPYSDIMGQVGTEQSLAARDKMQKSMNYIEEMKQRQQQKEIPHTEFKSFVNKTPQDIQALADIFSASDSKAAQSYVAPLLKASQADDRTRSAVLFGLYQQPAFREMKRKLAGDEEK